MDTSLSAEPVAVLANVILFCLRLSATLPILCKKGGKRCKIKQSPKLCSECNRRFQGPKLRSKAVPLLYPPKCERLMVPLCIGLRYIKFLMIIILCYAHCSHQRAGCRPVAICPLPLRHFPVRITSDSKVVEHMRGRCAYCKETRGLFSNSVCGVFC